MKQMPAGDMAKCQAMIKMCVDMMGKDGVQKMLDSMDESDPNTSPGMSQDQAARAMYPNQGK